MKVTVDINDLSYSSKPEQVEAYRRAIEIREFANPVNGSSQGQVERFSWTTKTHRGEEHEEVVIDLEEGILTYSVTQQNFSNGGHIRLK